MLVENSVTPETVTTDHLTTDSVLLGSKQQPHSKLRKSLEFAFEEYNKKKKAHGVESSSYESSLSSNKSSSVNSSKVSEA